MVREGQRQEAGREDRASEEDARGGIEELVHGHHALVGIHLPVEECGHLQHGLDPQRVSHPGADAAAPQQGGRLDGAAVLYVVYVPA